MTGVVLIEKWEVEDKEVMLMPMLGKLGKDAATHPSVLGIGKKFGKFCLVGGVGFLIAYGLLWILTEKAGLWYMHSALIAQVAATIWNFLGNLKWTFR